MHPFMRHQPLKNAAVLASIVQRDVSMQQRWIVRGAHCAFTPEFLDTLLQHYVVAAHVTFGSSLLGLGVCGSAAVKGPQIGSDVDLLIVVVGDWSLRIRGHYRGVDVDVFVEGIDALNQDLRDGYSSLHVNLMADMKPVSDPEGHLVALCMKARSLRAGQRPNIIIGLRELFGPTDLYRKLCKAVDEVEFTFIAARLIEVCLVAHFESQHYWLVGHANLLARLREIDEALYLKYRTLLERSINLETRKRAAREVVEGAVRRSIGDAVGGVSGVEYRHLQALRSMIGRA